MRAGSTISRRHGRWNVAGWRVAPVTIAVLGGVPFATPASAQRQSIGAPGDSVNSRSRPEYEAAGVRLGGLILRPQLATDLAYDNNIFRTDSRRRSDVYVSVRPRLLLESQSPRYPATLQASATIRRYAKVETENSEQYAVAGTLGAEGPGDMRIGAQASHARQLEPRGAAGDLFIGGKPIAYDLFEGGLTVSRDVGRVGVEAGGDVSRYAYRNARVGGVAIPQDFRDFRQTSGHVRLAYAISPAIAGFVRGSITHSSYDKVRTLDRSSNGYSIIVGVQLGITDLLSGTAGVGYLKEDFADPAYGDISGLDYDIALDWSPTPLIAVSVKGSRSLQRSPFIGSAGAIQTRLGGGVDYELLRQLILSADLAYTRETYRGLDRRDNRIEVQAGARYLVSRVVSLSLSANYRRQSSTGPGARDFDGFGASVGLTLQR